MSAILMLRKFIALVLLSALAACGAPTIVNESGIDIYRIGPGQGDAVQFRMLDGVNALRQSAGVRQVALSSELNAAAATHSRDMSVQNRPWHFGSDGSSPLERVARVGYRGQLVGELISETYETELQTLAAWMRDPLKREIILDPRAGNLGFSWFQEPSGKIWWTMVLGS